MDFVSKEKRSAIMRGVKGKDTKPETVVRSYLHRQGFRFRLHRKDLPGKPDIVLPKYKTAIFVHGCFWHQHPGCKAARIPKSNTEFWMEKFSKNKVRDKRNLESIRAIGWDPIVIWECELLTDKRLLDLGTHLRSVDQKS